jgi:chorismate synthase
MAGNSFGKHFQLTTFGESHGPAIGGVIDGIPAGLVIDLEAIQSELDRRKPGQSKITTSRKEEDICEFLSGLIEIDGSIKTSGTPIGFQILNKDSKSKDYSHLENTFRPSHADFTYSEKYGVRSVAGGGRSSARETACRVVGGAIARQLLSHVEGVEISAYVERVQDICMPNAPAYYSRKEVDESMVRCPAVDISNRMIQRIEQIRDQGDSVGGAIVVVARNVPSGWGEPVFDKLNADLAKGLMSIPA